MLRIAALMMSLVFATVTFAASPKTYQVTGPVVEVKDDVIVVQKGNEKWEIACDAATKVTGDVKVGEKVTIEYRMSAASIVAKGDKKEAKSDKKDAKKK